MLRSAVTAFSLRGYPYIRGYHAGSERVESPVQESQLVSEWQILDRTGSLKPSIFVLSKTPHCGPGLGHIWFSVVLQFKLETPL